MEITHELLLSLGFASDVHQQGYYHYKGVAGTLIERTGLFYFHGFSLAIGNENDLRYLLWLIDYNEQATLTAYPSHEN